MEKQPIYSITAYIPSDEKVISTQIYKICKISYEGHCVIISVKEDHGIGTATKYPQGIFENETEALLSLFRCGISPLTRVGRMSLKEALNQEELYIEELQKEL